MNLQTSTAIPVPMHVHGNEKHSALRLVLERLEPGESVYHDGMKLITAQSYCSRQGAYSGKRFTVRTEGDGIRCWRLE
jgi:hypothetical protein